MNWSGLAAASATFLGVWLGHVAVRRIEFVSVRLWPPALSLVLLGLALEAGSLASAYQPLSILLGILGVTVLWDALELARQAKRVRRGHAPANPANARHAQILKDFPAATTVDLLKKPD